MHRIFPLGLHRLRLAIACCVQGFWLALLLGFALLARAERADREKPTNVEADQVAYDDLKQTNVFTGNVQLTRGTLVILADKLTVWQDAQGYQYGTARGKPVYLREKRDGTVDGYIHAQGEQMEYDGRLQRVKLIGNAVLKRLEGAKVMEDARGSVIIYDIVTESYQIESGKGAVNANNPQGRVRIVLEPKPAEAKNAPPETQGNIVPRSRMRFDPVLKPAPEIKSPRPE